MNEKATRQLQSYTQNISFFHYAAKKTERLSRAIYLITNFFSDNEPIKWNLRRDSLDLLNHFSRFTTSTTHESSVDLSFIKHSLKSSLATLGVAHTAGLISEMNYSILRHEYELLLEELEAELGADDKHSPLLFPKDFFEVGEAKPTSSGRERYLYGTTFDGDLKAGSLPSPHTPERPAAPTTPTLDPISPTESATAPTSSKGHQGHIKDIKDTKRTEARTNVPETSAPSRTNRRDVIIQLVKDQKEITVKDVAREIQDVSEKTLQREIMSLVEAGVLERIGSRRWSRYRFAADL